MLNCYLISIIRDLTAISIVRCDYFIGKSDYMIHCIKNSYGTIDKTIGIGPAEWPHFDLIFVHSGQIQLELTGKRIKIYSGQTILIYPNTPFIGHTITATAKISVHHFSLGNDDNLPPSMVCFFGKNNGYKIYQPYETSTLEQDVERVAALAHENVLPTNEDIHSILMMLIISQLQSIAKQKKPKPKISLEFEKLKVWIKENLANNITLDYMADQVNLSTSHFRAIFKKQIGTSPGNYLLDIRINEAARLLRETLTPIKKIAQLTGYRDITHFYHAFRANYKITPKTYRNQHLPLG